MAQRLTSRSRRSLALACGLGALLPIAGTALPALADQDGRPGKGRGEALAKGPAGEMICAPRGKLVARLEQGRDFALQGQGLRDAEAMIEVRADPDGNWLMLRNYADGLSCLIAMGEAWEQGIATAPQAVKDGAAPAPSLRPEQRSDAREG